MVNGEDNCMSDTVSETSLVIHSLRNRTTNTRICCFLLVAPRSPSYQVLRCQDDICSLELIVTKH